MSLFEQWRNKRRCLTRLGHMVTPEDLFEHCPSLRPTLQRVLDPGCRSHSKLPATPVRIAIEMPFDYLRIEAPTKKTTTTVLDTLTHNLVAADGLPLARAKPGEDSELVLAAGDTPALPASGSQSAEAGGPVRPETGRGKTGSECR